MNQVEIIKAILAGEALDIKWRDLEWYTFNNTYNPIDDTLSIYVRNYDSRYKNAEFRIKPKTYQSRAYIDNEGGIFHWVSTNSMSQDDTINTHGYWARWIEETQTKEYV
jgi:hypothetical protein